MRTFSATTLPSSCEFSPRTSETQSTSPTIRPSRWMAPFELTFPVMVKSSPMVEAAGECSLESLSISPLKHTRHCPADHNVISKGNRNYRLNRLTGYRLPLAHADQVNCDKLPEGALPVVTQGALTPDNHHRSGVRPLDRVPVLFC